MKLTWTEPAIADRLAIYEWLELKNPAAAAKMMQKSLTRRHASCIIPPAGKRVG